MTPSRQSWLALAVAVAVAVAPLAIRSAHAGPQDDARLHYKQGATLYSAGKYREAIAEFAKAQALAPSPVLDFNIGLCHDRLGEKQEAVRRYKNYLEQQPNASNAAVVREKIKRLEGEIAADKAAAAKPAPAPEPTPDPAPAPTPEPTPPAVDPTPDPGPAEPAPEPAPDATVYDTGDPALDRVGNMSIVAIRDQYRAGGTAEPPPPAAGGDNAAQPPPPDGDTPAPDTAPPPPTDSGNKKDKPVYKKWWFWVVMGAGTLILINILTTDSGDSNAAMQNLPGSPSNDMGASPVLLRF